MKKKRGKELWHQVSGQDEYCHKQSIEVIVLVIERQTGEIRHILEEEQYRTHMTSHYLALISVLDSHHYTTLLTFETSSLRHR